MLFKEESMLKSGSPSLVEIIGVKGMPLINPGDDLPSLICAAISKHGIPLQDHDILVVAQTVVSKAEDALFKLAEVKPSLKAKYIAERIGKDPEIVELILREAAEIIRLQGFHLITRTRHGIICANSGVDLSNVSGGDAVTALPKDPDRSAKKLRIRLKALTGKNIAIIISDSSGRPFRVGQIGIAVGSSGLKPIFDRRGDKDLFGRVLKVKQTAVADVLASAAQLVIGEGAEGIPVAIIRGVSYIEDKKAKSKELNRPLGTDLFI